MRVCHAISVLEFNCLDRFGQDFEMNVDGFHLTGRLRCFMSASASAPFPHLTTAKVMFVKE